MLSGKSKAVLSISIYNLDLVQVFVLKMLALSNSCRLAALKPCRASSLLPVRINTRSASLRSYALIQQQEPQEIASCSQSNQHLTPAASAVPTSGSSSTMQVASCLAAATLLLSGPALAVDANVIAETAVTVENAQLAKSILQPLFSIFTILYIVRIPMTWYPGIDFQKLPWAIAYVPTEPVLSRARKVVPLLNGVDISPIVITGVLSFLSEVILGPQGILSLIEREGGL